MRPQSVYTGAMTTALPASLDPNARLEIFLPTSPGLETYLRDEVLAHRFPGAKAVPGGVITRGRWQDVWRANLNLRGAGRVLARIASFHVTHLAQLDKLSRRVDWASVLRKDVPFRVEATCKTSKIYHSGAAAERVEKAITATLGATASPDAPVVIKVRFENDECTLAVDTSGELLHKRGSKQAVNKAPLRETLASLFLRACGYDGHEPVLDPMCGAGTFVIEAAEIATGLAPGRARSFAFEHLATFDADAWAAMRDAMPPRRETAFRFYGSDRDAGAVTMSQANAERAGIADLCTFTRAPISDLVRPDGPPGLVIVNPPYGVRIGDTKPLLPLYRALGQTLTARFSGWRVGLVTTDANLAAATELPFKPPGPPIAHGGLRVTLFTTAPLP
jgi:putative N6-adenine-specific DNA methylase